MELQFDKQSFDCLQLLTSQSQYEEQTQEVRLSDSMPDIGKVLCGWGQVLLRGKEWRSGSVTASGGVMAWILYIPEDGSEPRSVETWVPFQIKWDVPESQRDGFLCVSCLLQGVDGRSLSARKLMVRVGIHAMAQILEPTQQQIPQPGVVPEDIQLLRNSYPMRIPREAGEKMFAMEEELTLPSSCQPMEKLIRFSLQPELIDRKVMADKVVFRGSGIVHILYRGTDGMLHSWDFDVPFSQYAQLEREYSAEAETKLFPAVTALELDQTDNGTLQLKAGVTCQYVIHDRPVVELVEDAYSVLRQVQPMMQQLKLPQVLDDLRENIRAEAAVETKGNRLADISFLTEHPKQRWNADEIQLEQPGQFQMLYYDEEGQLYATTSRWEGKWSIAAGEGTRVIPFAALSGRPQVSFGGDTASFRADVSVAVMCMGTDGIETVQGLQIGDALQKNAPKPSLILRRSDGKRLWDLAKEAGTTVEAICNANDLEGQPSPEQMLLIPLP